MTLDDIFNLWAPADGRWSPWLKPVLFSWMAGPPFTIVAAPATLATTTPIDLSDWNFDWLEPRAADTALVLDVPGPEAVALGMHLATLGFRPVPLFNALPSPRPPGFSADPNDDVAPELVDVASIVHALRLASPALAAIPLSPDAPPAFLLDSRRREASRAMTGAYFDNRSLSFPTDFPSANFLLAQTLRRCVVLQRDSQRPQADLAHTLRAWSAGGVRVEVKQAAVPGPPQPCPLSKPPFWQRLHYRLLEVFGYRRSVLGGFGGTLGEGGSGG